MKRFLLITLVLLFSQYVSAQKLYFSKANYADSLLFDKNISSLANQVIAKYHEAGKSDYDNNLFRLQLVGRQYNLVTPTLNAYVQELFGDSAKMKYVGFPYRCYASAMLYNKGEDDFAGAYKTTFNTLYNALTESEKGQVEAFFVVDLSAQKLGFNAKLKELSTSDSLTVADALALCKSYCSYKTYGRTQAFAKQILGQIEKENYIRQDSVLLTMPDGGTVSLVVVRSRKITTPQPVILQYNIYAGNEAAQCKDAVARGYAGVVANTRGKRLSSNVVEPFEHDAQDAYYIIDWISRQSWCNGKVGMYGGSYLGFSQWSAVKYLHPALKTIVPQVAVGAGIDYPMNHNIFMSYMLRWIHYVTDNKLTNLEGFSDIDKWNKTYDKWYHTGGSFRSLDTLEGRPNVIYQRWLQHPGYDDYWKNMTPQKKEFAKLNIPIFSTTGYFDADQLGAMYYYNQYHKWNKNPQYYLLIGPFDHGGAQAEPSAMVSNYKIDSVARIHILNIVFDWFDYVLKGRPRPAILKDKVNFEVMGTNKWQHVASLAKMHNTTLKFYFTNVQVNGQYSLSVAKPAKYLFIPHTVDLKDRSDLPASANGTSAVNTGTIKGELAPGKARLMFVSKPITKPLSISGGLIAHIMASVNKKDMDLALSLYEQTPDGKYFTLNDNLQRASYAKSRSKRELLTPGKATTINFNETFITSKLLQKGSRIIVLLGINKSPNWQINYGSGKDVSDETIGDAAIPMKIKWYNTSYIELPVLK